jgi:hypothetical protein
MLINLTLSHLLEPSGKAVPISAHLIYAYRLEKGNVRLGWAEHAAQGTGIAQ